MDRAHRFGQDKPVFVHRLIAEGTVETRIAEMQARKQALMDSVFDPEATGAMQNSEEVRGRNPVTVCTERGLSDNPALSSRAFIQGGYWGDYHNGFRGCGSNNFPPLRPTALCPRL